MKSLLRNDLRHFEPYVAPYHDGFVKLDANENPYGLSQTVLNNMLAWLSSQNELNRYPDNNNGALTSAIAAFFNVSQTEVVCGCGSDQLIDCATKAFLEPSDVVVMEDPSFSMYALTTTLNHGKPLKFALGERFFCGCAKAHFVCERKQSKNAFFVHSKQPYGQQPLCF